MIKTTCNAFPSVFSLSMGENRSMVVIILLFTQTQQWGGWVGGWVLTSQCVQRHTPDLHTLTAGSGVACPAWKTVALLICYL